MKRLPWELRRAAVAAGLPGVMAIVLLIACALAWMLHIEPMRGETVALRSAADRAQQRVASKTTATAAPVVSPQQQLDAFRQRLGDVRTLPTSIGKLQAIARRQGLRLEQAEFRFIDSAGEPVLRYTIELPIKADYRALRRFTRAAMLELPGLAIEEVGLRRADPKLPTLDAQVRFVLFLSRGD